MQPYLFDLTEIPVHISVNSIDKPKGYTGLYGFHKYWGKKPSEPIAFIINELTNADDTILDPFVGSGITARESLLQNRRFIGFDINPIAIEITRLLASPPDYNLVQNAFQHLENTVKETIKKTYVLQDGDIASHYLWENNQLKEVWLRGSSGSRRKEMSPTKHDLKLINKYKKYRSRYLRQPNFFSNSRINANRNLTLSDVFTGRAQLNLDHLLDGIRELPPNMSNPLKLCLTAASGQMTKMVFAITQRGKTGGKTANKVEVGSWTIGYWRPNLHFEVNVWNCFERRVKKLLKSLEWKDPLNGLDISSLADYYKNTERCCIECLPCQNGINRIKDHSIKLILTDPPHSDRIPYLELSELWNSILGVESKFDDEIVISNAKERGKSPENYEIAMKTFFSNCTRVLRDDGFLVLIYNARQSDRWGFVNQMIKAKNDDTLKYVGYFPCNYSAGSVVQDNRKGGLKNDLALVFANPNIDTLAISSLFRIPNWSDQCPISQ